jgi:CspA family cold shock protein
MPIGKVKLFNEERGFGFIKPDDGTGDVFFHITALREGADVAVGVGIAVSFEMGTDKRTGKTKAVSVDLV